MFWKFISLPVFLISLTVGSFFVYLTRSDPTVIYVYPTPDNINKVQYRDKADTCYQFDAEVVNCPLTTPVKNIPLQK